MRTVFVFVVSAILLSTPAIAGWHEYDLREIRCFTAGWP